MGHRNVVRTRTWEKKPPHQLPQTLKNSNTQPLAALWLSPSIHPSLSPSLFDFVRASRDPRRAACCFLSAALRGKRFLFRSPACVASLPAVWIWLGCGPAEDFSPKETAPPSAWVAPQIIGYRKPEPQPKPGVAEACPRSSCREERLGCGPRSPAGAS